MTIVKMEDEQELVCDLSNGVAWVSLTQILKSRYSSTSDNSKTVQDSCPWQTDRKSYMIYRIPAFSVTLNDP